ncbi:MAG: glycosyltransferase [Ferruginibacter sp.]
MILKKINKPSKKITILVVPLDWGLGHATRCIPLIHEFLAKQCNVIIAADGAVKSLLQIEFQQLTFLPIKGYGVRYSNQKRWLSLKLITQVPSVLLRIYKEHQWLKKVVKKYTIDAVLADNRFGLYHSHIPSIYITHQVLIKTGSRFSEQIALKIHAWFINKFTFCWIPDFEGEQNIAGELSHPAQLPINSKYIGCLSRFEKKEGVQKIYDLLIIISGPEPQRTLFETILLKQLKSHTGKTLLVRGLPGGHTNGSTIFGTDSGNKIMMKDHLSSQELNDAILQAEMVISRSGYTTLMDLIKLGQKAILVPTPGQTEQEYLATHSMRKNLFYAVNQEDFILAKVLEEAAVFPFTSNIPEMEQYKKNIGNFVQLLTGEHAQAC